MIIWTGWGIATPFIIGGGIIGVVSAAEFVLGTGYPSAHNWVGGLAIGIGGFLCWWIGKWLYRRDHRVLVDKSSGREVRVGASHTLFFIPMHWFGVFAILFSIPVFIYGVPKSNRRVQTASSSPERPIKQILTEQSLHFNSVPEAQQAALRQHPELGVVDSKFNKKFRDLHKSYQQTQPELFRNNGWPVVIANEVAQTINSN